MRRFIAYITLLFTILFSIGISIKPVLTSVNSQLDFTDGKVLTYKLTNSDQNVVDSDGTFGNNEQDVKTIEDVSEEMSSRLNKYGVEQYDIKIVGNDTIEVSLYAKNSDKYSHIETFLGFNGKLTLTTSDNEFVFSNYNNESATIKDMFTDNAYLDFKNVYPAVVLPITDVDKMKEAIEHAKSLDKKDENQATDSDTTSISDESYLYLWSNWNENCNYENSKTYTTISDKMVMRYAYNNIWWEEKEDDYASIASLFNVTGNSNSSATTLSDLEITDILSANENAKFFVNLLNSPIYDCNVTFIHEEAISPIVENAINKGTSINPVFNSVLIGFLVGYVLLIAFGFIFFKLIGVNFALTSLLGVILTGALFNALGASYSIASLCAFICVSIIITGVALIYAARIKKELSSDKPIKKSIIDSSNSNVLLTIDVSVVMLILGVFIYTLGGAYISSMGVCLILGAFVNLLINLLVNRLLFTTLANSKYGEKLSLYGVVKQQQEVEHVEVEHNVLDDLKNDQKQQEVVKENAQEKKNKLTKRGLIGIIYGCIIAAGIVCSCVFGLTSTPYVESSLLADDVKLIVSVEKDNTILDDSNNFENLVKQIKIGADVASSKEIYNTKENIYTYEFTQNTETTDLKNSISKTFVYYEVIIDTTLNIKDNKIFVNGVEKETITTSNFISAIEENAEQLITGSDNKAFVSLSKTRAYGLTDTYYIPSIALACSISIIVACAYLWIRYRTTLALSTSLISMGTTAIALTLFAMLRTPVTAYISLIAVVTAIISIFLSTIICEDFRHSNPFVKGQVLSIEDRHEQLQKSIVNSRDICLGVTCIGFIFFLCFLFGGKLAIQNLFIAIPLLLFVSYAAIFEFTDPLYYWLMQVFHVLGTHVHKPTTGKKVIKQKHREHQRGKEVEEATFIGIND